jgi:hypothetical protein
VAPGEPVRCEQVDAINLAGGNHVAQPLQSWPH